MPPVESTSASPIAADARIEAVNRLWREYEGMYDAAALRLGIPGSVLDALYLLSLEDGITQRDICERSCRSKQTVHSAIIRLEREGFVKPERGRGRSVRLYLTDAGRAEAKRTALPVIEAEHRAYASLGSREFDQLILRLEQVGTRLKQELEQVRAPAGGPRS